MSRYDGLDVCSTCSPDALEAGQPGDEGRDTVRCRKCRCPERFPRACRADETSRMGTRLPMATCSIDA